MQTKTLLKLKEINILIIEDDESEAILLSELLSEYQLNDYNISHVVSLEEALEFIPNNDLEVVLVDLNLPDSFGIHTFVNLFEQFPHIPFIVMTAIEDDIIGINAVQKGAQDFLIKNNFDSIFLNRAIHYAIERKNTEEKLRKSEERYRDLFMRSQDAIYISSIAGKFIDINPAGLKMFGYEKEDLNSLSVLDLYKNPMDRIQLVEKLDLNEEIVDYEVQLKKKDPNEILICLLNTLALKNSTGETIAFQGIIRDITARKKAESDLKDSLHNLDRVNKELMELNASLESKVNDRTMELLHEKELVDKQNKEITQSINYAKRIQTSIMPDSYKIKSILPDSFVFYKPKDIVSGDFYWFQHIKNKAILAVVDCTGHGVPGAFMSIIGHTQLNQIVVESKIYNPGVILQELDKKVKIALNQYKNTSGSNDGMELGIISIDFESKKLEFAGAMRPLYYFQKDRLNIIKGDKHSIGGVSTLSKKFHSHSIPIQTHDSFYLFTDGYPDQFGGPKGKKFKTHNVEKMLLAIHHLNMHQQSKIVEESFDSWKANEDQIDDVLMAGIKF